MSKATEDFIARSKARMTAAKATPAHTPGKWAHDTMIAGRDARILELSAENTRLRIALQALVELGDHVPVFQLDDGKSSVKAVRMAGKFMAAMRQARAALGGQA